MALLRQGVGGVQWIFVVKFYSEVSIIELASKHNVVLSRVQRYIKLRQKDVNWYCTAERGSALSEYR